jgi:60 kDa SS-A/Ro ribonucleoprotein
MRFNLKKALGADKRANSVNLAGGLAHAETPKLELASILLTTTLKDEFYRKADATAKRLQELAGQIADRKFVAKAAIYARKEAGMRSGSHLVAAELAKLVKGEAWMSRFLQAVVKRPDDVLEILACFRAQYGKVIPNSLKRGLGRALATFDAYQLAKYRKSAAEWSLVDAVNLLHPPHTEALAQLVKGTLPAADTWETRLTQTGSQSADEAEKEALKAEAWTNLVKERKLGYFALLRNLRNILQTAPYLVSDLAEMLVNETAIRKSLVLPFRFLTALEALQSAGLQDAGKLMTALSRAVDLSLRNVPRFAGKTLVVVDTSGSMSGRPIKIASLFAATLLKSNDADLMQFSDKANYLSMNAADSTLTLAQAIEQKAMGGGTNFHSIFATAKRAYDRVIILSDMQGWIGHYTPKVAYDAWKQRTKANPKVYSFDLAGYGSLQFPESQVYCLAGFSDQTMDTLQRLESDPRALLRMIEAVEL